MVVTANPELLQQAGRDGELMRVLNSADIVVADGVGVVWASRRLGRPLPERVPGIDLMSRLIERAAGLGLSVYFLGGRPGVAERAAKTLSARYPGLRVAGVMHGYFNPEEERAVIDRIREARPAMLFVGLGQPRQELFIARHKHLLGAALAMGIGGSMDVIAGDVGRAPRWMQDAGIEWIYRLVSQPGRARRHLALPLFALRVLRESTRARRGRPGGTA
jgi:N-acetylglucosaminyldiphosphoundecaprenol N-acetyl-beta-D-mannosaminyltransferase